MRSTNALIAALQAGGPPVVMPDVVAFAQSLKQLSAARRTEVENLVKTYKAWFEAFADEFAKKRLPGTLEKGEPVVPKEFVAALALLPPDEEDTH